MTDKNKSHPPHIKQVFHPRIWMNFLSFEWLFVLFLFSYQYKNALSPDLSVDMTLLLAFILIPFSIFLYRKNPPVPFFDPIPISLFLFTIWAVFSVIWSPQTPYVWSKILCFVVYTLPAFLMAYFLIARSSLRLRRFLFLALFFAVCVHLEAYRTFIHHGKAIVDVLGNNYLVTGQTLGVGFLLLVPCSYAYLKRYSEGFFLYEIALLLCGTLWYIQMNLGGRGPVVSMVLSLLLFYGVGAFKTSDTRLYLKHGISVGLSCYVMYFFLGTLFSTDVSHFLRRSHALWTLQDASTIERLDYYASALTAYLQHPFSGVGFGGWPFYHQLGLREWHPHNMMLEILSETGTPGAVFFSSFLFYCFRSVHWRVLWTSFDMSALGLILLFSIGNALKSGDLNDNILFFVVLGLLSGYSQFLKGQQSSSVSPL